MISDKRWLGNNDFLIYLPAFFMYFTTYMWAPNLKFADLLFRSNSYGWWNSFQKDSDALVISRFISDGTHGLISFSGALGDGGFYRGQFGLSGWLISSIPYAMRLNIAEATWLMYGINAIGNSLFVAALTVFLWKRLGKISALLFTVFLIQPWPSALLHSIYWSIWVKFIPGLICYFVLKNRISRLRCFFFLMLSSTCTFLSGYEYATVVFFSVLAIFVYFAILDNNLVSKKTIVQGAFFSLAVGLGFIFSLAIHLVQMISILGNFDSGLHSLIDTITKRTGVSSMTVDPVFAESLAVHPSKLLEIYLNMPILFSPGNFGIMQCITVTTLIATVLSCTWLTVKFKSGKSLDVTYFAIFGIWILNLLGTIGWYLLARPHSYIHTHINFALWYLFSVPLGVALLANLLIIKLPRDKYQSFKVKSEESTTQQFRLLILFTGIILVLFYFYSEITVRP